MIALLLILTWISQGIPAPPSQTGTVTGTLKTNAGTPAVGVRVGAMVRPESPTELSSASALSSIAETDAAGHFRLENVPQGRYYITAGRVDYPTFFPGTQDINAGRVVLVKPGDVITGIDFAMNAIAVRPPDSSFGTITTLTFNIPVSIGVEGGSAAPVFSDAGFAALRLTRTTDGQVTEMPMSTSSLVMAIPPGGTPPEYQIGIENLPKGYGVGSIRYGVSVITNNILKLSIASAPATGTVFSPFGVPAGAQTLSNIVSSFAGGPALTITLLSGPPAATASGVRVTGSAPTAEVRSVYLSGVPGIFFADGSFEFRNVKPGRYTVSTPDNPSSSRPLAAAIAVGDQDVAGIELTATPLLPLKIKTPVPPEPIGNHTPGSTIPLAIVRGLVLDETTHEPITEGTVYLTGHYGGSRSLVPDGRFEFTRLLPGSYELEVQAFGHNIIKKTVVVGEADVNLEFSTMPFEELGCEVIWATIASPSQEGWTRHQDYGADGVVVLDRTGSTTPYLRLRRSHPSRSGGAICTTPIQLLLRASITPKSSGMFAFLFALTLFVQGTTLQNDNGTITGVLKTSTGQPAAGVRVAAMAIPESKLDAVTGAAMASLVTTDEAGRYRLENIPPGRYYITAGRVDFPTYFPGALDMSAGTVVSVTSKATITDLNFTLQDASIRKAATDPFLAFIQPALTVPILARVENGGKQPVSANGAYVTVGLTRTADGVRNNIPLSAPVTSAAVPSAIVGAEYRITVDNLPNGYVLKALTFGSTDLTTDTLKLTAANFLQLAPASTVNGFTVSVNGAAYAVTLQTVGGTTTSVPISAPPLSGVASNAINVTLGTVPSTLLPLPGVRITGRAPVNGAWSVYRGDVPGIFYADGTFELKGVPPGRHIILLQDNSSLPQAPRFYAALVNVSDRNLEGVVLESTNILPTNDVDQTSTAGAPTSNGAQPLAGFFGRVVEEADGRPIAQGSVTVLGRTRTTLPIGQDGMVVIPHLLPGSYDFRVEVYEHFTRYETVVIADQDVHIDLAVRSNLATADERATSQAEPPR